MNWLQLSLQTRQKALAVFHAFAGCDTTSSFAGQFRKSAWETWSNFPQVISASLEVYSHSAELSESCLAAIEHFVVQKYMTEQASVGLWTTLVSSCSRRKVKHWKTFHQHDDLMQHSKRSAYQAGHVWSPCLLTDPSNSGWTMANNWWTEINDK